MGLNSSLAPAPTVVATVNAPAPVAVKAGLAASAVQNAAPAASVSSGVTAPPPVVAVPSTAAGPLTLNVSTGMVLTVGAGMEFSTLGAALRNAVNGDTIAVKAGTYVNDFGVVSAAVSIVAVGGMVNEVGTEPPPNGKGLLTVDNDLTIRGFSFTGAATSDEYGNVAGIRYEQGNLNVSYCDFHDLQDGMLATPFVDGTGSVSIDHSEFDHDGTGDGYTHDIYIGGVASFSLTNSYIHDAVVGHEVKSRAESTYIAHNVIADGPTGTGSYDIDVPNAGAATILDNVIEKGPLASNAFAIHYGGETQYAYTNNSLTISGNTIINDQPGDYAVLNQSAVNGLNVSAVLTDNQLYGFTPSTVIYGNLGTETGDTVLSSEPTIDTSSPWTALPAAIVQGPERLTLVTQHQTVGGGASMLTVNDGQGSNEIDGGSGGMVAFVAGQYEMITTAAGAADTVSASGQSDTVQSAGADRIYATGIYQEIDTTGQATVVGTSFNSYNLNGAGEVLQNNSSAILNIGAAATARIVDHAGDLKFSMAAGAVATFADLATIGTGGTASAATISGGAASGWVSSAGMITVTTGDGGARVQTGTGTVSVTGGAGPDTMVAGSGSASFALGGGKDTVVFGHGAGQATSGTGADTYIFRAGADGTDTISGFKQGTDSLQFTGFTGNAIASGSIVGGSTLLTLTDGTTVDVAGVALPGYPGASAPASGSGTTSVSGGGGGSGATPPVTTPVTGSGTLNTAGHVVTGGATLLTVTDAAGGNTIAGGSGGLVAIASTGDLITTAPGAADTISLLSYDTLTGGGSDQVTVSGIHNTVSETGAATIAVTGGNNAIQGGAGLLQVTDQVSGNTIAGGAGGVVAQLAGSYDQVSTSAGAQDTVSVADHAVVISAGTDQITIAGLYNQVTATGAASIASTSAFSTYDFEGQETLQTSGGGNVTIGGGASAALNSTGDGGLSIAKMAGGSVTVSQVTGGDPAAATVSGAAASLSASGGQYAGVFINTYGGASVVAGSGAVSVTSSVASGVPADTINAGAGSLSVTTNGSAQIFGGSGSLLVNAGQEAAGASGISLGAGSGNVTLNGGAGNELFTGGSGQAQIWLGGGQDTVSFGSGLTTVHGGVADAFVLPTNGGSAVILNWNDHDTLVGSGGSSATPFITSQSVVNGSTILNFVGGGQIQLSGVSTHFA